MTPATLLEHLETWYRQGKLRLLDISFARWCARHDPAPTPELLLVAALVAYLEGRGHSCLDLDSLLPNTLNLGMELEAELAQVLAELPCALTAWQNTLYDSPCVSPPSSPVASPLVLAGTRLYLRRYWQYETALSQQIRQRTDPALWSPDALTDALPWLHALFPAHSGIHWQRVACALALRSPFTLITGGPGTGKTYTAARLLTVLLSQSARPEALRIALTAPTGKAAARLTESLRKALRELPSNLPAALDISTLIEQVGPARTLHSLLGQDWTTRQFRHDAAHPLDLDLLIVDEASMVDLKMMVALFDALPPRSRIVLLGDRDQLASVEAGAVLGDLCLHAESGHYRPETASFLRALGEPPLSENLCDPKGSDLAQCRVMLRHSHRFGTAIGALAMAVNTGDATSALRLLKQETHASLAWKECSSPQEVVEIATCPTDLSYEKFSRLLQSRPAASADFEVWALLLLQTLDRFRVLCALREGPWGVIELNRSIERQLWAMGGLQPQGEWYEGRPVIITRNDADLSLANGDIGLTLRSPHPAQGLRVYFPDTGRTLHARAPNRLNHAETAFALTVHKSQGSEFEHTCLVLPAPHPIVTRELIYTGITRARERLTLLSADPTTLEVGLARPTQRTSGLKFES